MSRFFVGQRVRVNCPTSEVHGVECRITCIDKVYDEAGLKGVGYAVDIPWVPEPDDEEDFQGYGFLENELDPILPAHEPVAISAILEEFPSLAGVMGVVA